MTDVPRDARLDAFHADFDRLLDSYCDVLGPACWCGPVGHEGDDHAGPPGDPCPNVPPTVALTGWVLTIEYADLNPGGWVGTTYRSSYGQSPNLSKGLHARALEHY